LVQIPIGRTFTGGVRVTSVARGAVKVDAIAVVR
jgi:hypothetical protein